MLSARYRRIVAACAAGLATALVTVVLVAALGTLHAAAFQRVQDSTPKPEMMENCPGLVATRSARSLPASLRLALASDQVRFTYAGHSTFLIESPHR